jgi:pantoate--beta-alanine ligase
MIISEHIEELKQLLAQARLQAKTIGFVPTMGALHQGHLELMKQAKRENNILVVSIFVNPIQFNNPEDLKKYPRTIETDSQMLESIGCDFLFYPSAKEMYPKPDTTQYDFGALAQNMEGEKRPGHFNGVAIVVRKLFEIVEPDKAYFGEKDYQQLAIIQALVRMLNMPVQVIPCPIVRETDGLAMSSRNRRLSEEARHAAPFIYETLKRAITLFPTYTPQDLIQWVAGQFDNKQVFTVDYIEIADDQQLQPIQSWQDADGILLFVAVFLDGVRLIDNIRII